MQPLPSFSMTDSESVGVEIGDASPKVIAVAAGPSSNGGAATAGRRPVRSSTLAANKRTSSNTALVSFFSSSAESESATDGDNDEDDGDTDYTQTRGSDDQAESEDDSDSDDDGGGGGNRKEDPPRRRSQGFGAHISRSPSPSGLYSDGGYTSGFTTGDDSEELFDEDLDPMSLLEELEQHGAAAGTATAAAAVAGGLGAYGGGTSASAPQPFELIRVRRRAHRMAAAAVAVAASTGRGSGATGSRRRGANDMEDTVAEEDGDVNMEEAAGAGPSNSRPGSQAGRGRGGGRAHPSTAGTSRGRGRPPTRRRSSAASDVFGADVDDIFDDPLAERLGIVEPGSRRRGRGRGRGKTRRRGRPKRGLPEEVVSKLGQANVMYALRDYQPAIELLTQVIKEYPNISDPYHTLGLLHEANGNPRKALDFFMLAAHLSPRDLALWKRLAAMSTELGFLRQAVYCLTKAIKRNRLDLDALWDRALLYAQVGDMDKALAQFAEVGRLRPGDPEVPVWLARLHHQGGAQLKAIAVLEAHLRDHPSNVDLTHINILAELYMERGGYAEARALIERAGPVLCPDQALPLDLAVKSGLCLAHTGRWEESDDVLGELLREPVEQFGDLYLAVGSALAGLGQHEKALQYLVALLEHPDYNEPGLWSQLLKCHVAMGEVSEGLELYKGQMQTLDPTDPGFIAAALTLAEMCVGLGEQGRAAAQEMISLLDGVLERHGGGGRVSPAECFGEELAMKLSQLYLQLNMLERYVSSIQPAVKSSLDALSADLAKVTDPNLPLPLKRAIMRRRMFERKGGRKGEGAAETSSVFKGATRRDRRSARTREYDRKAAEVLGLPYEDIDTEGGGVTASGGSGLEGSATEATDGGGSDSGGDFSGGEGWRRSARSSGGPKLPRGGLIGPSVLSDPAQAQVLLQLTRALALLGRPDEATALLDRAIALVVSSSGGGHGGGGGGGGGEGGGAATGSLSGLTGKRVGGPWFDRAVIDRLRLGQLELASMAAAAGLGPNAVSGGILDASQLAALKSLTNRWPYSIALWNLYCLAHAQGTDLRSWAMHITTLRRRNPLSVPLMLLQGHVYLLARQFREASSEYFQAYRFVPEEPIVLLCLAVSLLSEAMASAAAVAPGGRSRGTSGATTGAAPQQLPPQRHSRSSGPVLRDRNRGVLAGFAFLQAYQKVRGEQLAQEVAYNMGRAAHQLGLLHIAHHYYELALATPPAVGLPISQSTVAGGAAASAGTCWSARWDLRRDAAHNLVQLYRSSGATALAREVMSKYLVF